MRSFPEVNFRENEMEQGPEGMKTKRKGKEREQEPGLKGRPECPLAKGSCSFFFLEIVTSHYSI